MKQWKKEDFSSKYITISSEEQGKKVIKFLESLGIKQDMPLTTIYKRDIKAIFVYSSLTWKYTNTHSEDYKFSDLQLEEKEQILTIEQLIEGEVYSVNLNNGSFTNSIFKCSQKGTLKYTNIIFVNSENFYKNDELFEYNLNMSTLRVSTTEEINHLNICIQENKFIEFNEINNYMNKETKFEVGNWYKIKFYENSYFKFAKLVKNEGYNTIYCIDRIWRGNYVSGNTISNKEAEKSSVLLTDLTEIQEFLPTNHSDKIVKQEEKWKVGDWVFIKDDQKNSLGEGVKFDKIINNCLQIEKLNGDFVIQLSGINCLLNSGRFRKALPHEIPNNSSVNTFNFEKGKYYKADYEDKITYFVYSKIVGNILYTNGWRWSTETTFNDGREDISTYYLDRIKNPIIVSEVEAKGHIPPSVNQSIKEENMFKQGDYIVCLKKPGGNLEYLPPNYCYKQVQDHSSLFAIKDIHGSNTSCTDVRKDKPDTWRYATSKEIAEYNRIGKPFDVTTLNKSKEKDLLSLAKLKYPIGTKFITAIDGKNTYEVKGNVPRWHEKDISIALSDTVGLVYYKGKWAEIVKQEDNSIPEYVECYKSDYKKHERVYKVDVKNSKEGHFCLPELQELRGGHNTPLSYLFIMDGGVWKFRESTKEAYLKQEGKTKWNQFTNNFQSNSCNISVDLYKNEEIEVGDEVEVTEQHHSNDASVGSRGIVHKIDKFSDVKYCIKNEKFPRGTTSWCVDVKLIKKKHSNTTVNKQLDISSAIQVGNEVTNITIPKSASVVLKNTENEVKIKINQKLTIKI